jgi:pullulanase-type alpha-1,6-glucosidase
MKSKLLLVINFLLLVVLLASPAFALRVSAADVEIKTVTIPGTLQSELGCTGDWMPSCEKTGLTYDAVSGIWKGTFEVTPNNDQDKKGPRYKAAINGTWDINYGKNASQGGADIPLAVDAPIQVTFLFDPNTHWVTDDYNTPIINAVGDFQTQLDCTKDNDPACLRGWLEDPEGDGTYSFTTKALKAGTYSISLNIEQKGVTTTTEPQSFTVAKDGDEIYFGYDTVKAELVLSTSGAPKGSLAKLKAIWVNQDTILWNVVGSPKYTYTLFYSPDATLALTSDGVQNGREIPLTFSKSGPGGDVFKLNPYLGGYSAFKIDPKDFAALPEALKGQLAVVVRDDKSKVIDATGVQIAGALDGVYSYDGPLGVTFEGDTPTLRVWAPTATALSVLLFDDALTTSSQKLPMTYDEKTGVWSLTGQQDWKGKYYLYEAIVYVPSTGKIETNQTTDPYSLSLSTNSLRSQIVNLEDADLQPAGWKDLQKPALAAPEDSVIYELHIRDFSISDTSVPQELRGTFKAFTVKDSLGMQHLAALAKAGLTHIHLLPAFDIASVNEDKSTWKTVDNALLATYPPDSDQQALAVSLIRGEDGFNWGYDPYHYTAPEGSYATDPNGTPRIVEFREMVQALNQTGLRVVMDVVYNHTSQSGQDPKSVLDKLVPGYYYRLNTEGKVETSTCCQDTASEHTMMRKLMVDSVVTWAKEYKVDGFRFDLMGFHMLSDMQAVRAALDSLTLEKDGVDGKAILIYGEGWNFGEVANNARGINATQMNIGGTGIGVFNDRLRDGARGGNPFDDPRLQGFTTGLLLNPSLTEKRTPEQQKAELFDYTDWIKLGMAGNLRDYQIVRSNGDTVDGAHVYYNGSAAGYTLDPQENINYVSAHDNETIFDAIQLKAAKSVILADRVRMNNLALSIPMLGQGIPFFHAGDDILRSKSLDRNSYDSGDWFNKLDWTLQTDNWGVGLPIEGTDKYDIYKPLLADPALKPGKEEITFSSQVFQEFLQIRKSSPLFRLQTGGQVKSMVSFLNNGPEQIPGLIVMRIEDKQNLDPNYGEIVVLINAGGAGMNFSDPAFTGKQFTLHPVQVNSVDAVGKTAAFDSSKGQFSVPRYSTAVFVSLKPAQPAATVPAATVQPQSAPQTAQQPVKPDFNLFIAGGIAAILILLAGVLAYMVSRKKG